MTATKSNAFFFLVDGRQITSHYLLWSNAESCVLMLSHVLLHQVRWVMSITILCYSPVLYHTCLFISTSPRYLSHFSRLTVFYSHAPFVNFTSLIPLPFPFPLPSPSPSPSPSKHNPVNTSLLWLSSQLLSFSQLRHFFLFPITTSNSPTHTMSTQTMADIIMTITHIYLNICDTSNVHNTVYVELCSRSHVLSLAGKLHPTQHNLRN